MILLKSSFSLNHFDPKQNDKLVFIFLKMTGAQNYFWIKILFLKINPDMNKSIKVSFILIHAI